MAAIVSPNPVAYVATNMQSVIADDPDYSDSDDSNWAHVHCSSPCTTVVSSTKIPASTVKQIGEKVGPAPFFEPHLWWHCSTDVSDFMLQTINALIDPGSHAVLICADLVDTLLLHCRLLHKPKIIELLMESNGQKSQIVLHEYVKLRLYNPSNYWQSRTVQVIITPTLCAPVILGLPFLVHNHIVIDHADRTVIDKISGFDLLNPKPLVTPLPPKPKLKNLFTRVMATRKLVSTELRLACQKYYHMPITVEPINIIMAVQQTFKNVTAKVDLERMGTKIMNEFMDIFEPIPHINKLPTDVYCNIELKDATQKITSRSYSMPQKYRYTWKTLIDQHVHAGCLQPSNLVHASPAFLVPKTDPNVLP